VATLHLALAVVNALIVVMSAVMKLKRDPKVVAVIHDVVGVPMKWMTALAACEIAGGAGLLLGIVWPPLGVAAGVGLVIYFVGAVVSHLRVGDVKGLGPAVFVLALSTATLVTRVLSIERT
jgi:hypothetical protein